MAVGRCWTALASGIPGFVPLPEEHVALVGARSFDDAEYRARDRSRIHLVPAAGVGRPGSLEAGLDRLAG